MKMQGKPITDVTMTHKNFQGWKMKDMSWMETSAGLENALLSVIVMCCILRPKTEKHKMLNLNKHKNYN